MSGLIADLISDMVASTITHRKKIADIFIRSNVLAVIAACVMLLTDGFGKTQFNTGPAFHDFQSFWSAAIAAKLGLAGKAYDVHWFVAHIKETIGPEAQQYGWHYPPQFFLPLLALTMLPLPVAFILWTVLPLIGLAWLAYRLIPDKEAPLFVLGTPILIINTGYAQNGVITAVLIGCALLPFVEQRKPSGLMTSLLAFKPHLGLAFPAAYAGGRFWSSIGLTLVWLAVQASLTTLVLGPQIWGDFLASLANTRTILFTEVGAGAHHYVSVYGAVRLLKGGSMLAYAVQAIISAAMLALLWRAWRLPIERNLKAALLVATIPLTAPYLMHYDLCIDIMAVLFLIRYKSFESWSIRQQALLIAVWFLGFLNLLIQEYLLIPSGLICSLVIHGLVIGMMRDTYPAFIPWSLAKAQLQAEDQAVEAQGDNIGPDQGLVVDSQTIHQPQHDPDH